jgi:hypothetical protein
MEGSMHPLLLGMIAACVTCGVIALRADITHIQPGFLGITIPPLLVGVSAILMAIAVKIMMRS